MTDITFVQNVILPLTFNGRVDMKLWMLKVCYIQMTKCHPTLRKVSHSSRITSLITQLLLEIALC